MAASCYIVINSVYHSALYIHSKTGVKCHSYKQKPSEMPQSSYNKYNTAKDYYACHCELMCYDITLRVTCPVRRHTCCGVQCAVDVHENPREQIISQSSSLCKQPQM